MATQPVPTTISQLLETATKATGNIAAHREAMAKVAAEAKASQPQPKPEQGAR